jgi:hypothetical protein
MKQLMVAALVLGSGCAHGTSLFHRSPPAPERVADSLYWSAVRNLIPSNKNGSRDSAITLLNAYLGSPAKLHHIAEATAFVALARDAEQLARVQASLQQTRSDAKESSSDKPRADSDAKSRDDDTVKEIARLKDELARANEELDRIKKRLAAPPPKP